MITQRTNEGRFAAGHAGMSGNANPIWKGNAAGYSALHKWVASKLGRPMKCERCGTTQSARFEWANVSGKYKRLLADWIRLCRSCHRVMDGNHFQPGNKFALSHAPRRGETSPKAKLTNAKVLEIRRAHRLGEASLRELAKINGVSYSLVWRVVHNEMWAHI